MEIVVGIYLVGSLLSWGIASALDEDGKKDWLVVVAFLMSWYSIGVTIGIIIREYDKERRGAKK